MVNREAVPLDEVHVGGHNSTPATTAAAAQQLLRDVVDALWLGVGLDLAVAGALCADG